MNTSANTFERDLEMMRYFQEEFMFRHKHFWDILIRFFVLFIIITILPIAKEVLGITLNHISPTSLFFFPILGFIVALLSLFILIKEAKKMRSVNDAKYRINRQYMEQKYHYAYYNDTVDFHAAYHKKWLSVRMPWFVFSLQVIIVIYVCAIIYLEYYHI